RQRESGNVDLDQLRELVPPETVTLRGFMVLKAVDVTDQEVLSSLKRDLIDKESIVSSARFESLQAKLRTLFRRPSLHLGLAALEGDRVLVLNDAMSHDRASIFADSAHHKTSEFTGSLYVRAVIQNRPVNIGELAAWTGDSGRPCSTQSSGRARASPTPPRRWSRSCSRTSTRCTAWPTSAARPPSVAWLSRPTSSPSSASPPTFCAPPAKRNRSRRST